ANSNPYSQPYSQPPPTGHASLILVGDLYAVVEPKNAHTALFGSSGSSLAPGEALRMVHSLHIKGDPARALRTPKISGGTFTRTRSIGYFNLRCPGIYRLRLI